MIQVYKRSSCPHEAACLGLVKVCETFYSLYFMFNERLKCFPDVLVWMFYTLTRLRHETTPLANMKRVWSKRFVPHPQLSVCCVCAAPWRWPGPVWGRRTTCPPRSARVGPTTTRRTSVVALHRQSAVSWLLLLSRNASLFHQHRREL